jgi:hypothetical protein
LVRWATFESNSWLSSPEFSEIDVFDTRI